MADGFDGKIERILKNIEGHCLRCIQDILTIVTEAHEKRVTELLEANNASLQRERAARRPMPLSERPLVDGWYMILRKQPSEAWPAFWYFSRAEGWNIQRATMQNFSHWCPIPTVPE